MTDAPKLWTPQECAAYLDVSTERLSKMRVDGTGPKFGKVGKEVRYIPGVVAAWFKDRLVESTAEARNRA